MEKHWIDYVDIFLDPVVAIGTFILGYLIANRLNNKTQEKELNLLFNYFTLYLDGQNQSIDKQVESFKEQIVKVDALTSAKGCTITIVSQPYYILDSINKEKLIEAFRINNKKISDAMKIIGYIELSRKTFDHYLTYHQNFLNRQNDIRMRWNTAVQNINLFRADLLSRPKEEIIASEELLKINDIFNNWNTPNEVSFDQTIETLTTPLEEYFKPLYSEQPNHPFAKDCILYSQKISMIYSEFEADKSTYLAYLNSLSETMLKHKSDSKIKKYSA